MLFDTSNPWEDSSWRKGQIVSQVSRGVALIIWVIIRLRCDAMEAEKSDVSTDAF